MSTKVILVICAQALFIQTAFSSCLGRGAIAAPTLIIAPACAGNSWASNGLISNGLIGNGCAGNWAKNGMIGDGMIGNGWAGNGMAGLEIIPTSGVGLPVSSVSVIAPSGLSVASENAFEGALSVAGELPFVSAVALDAVLPSAGAGAINYSYGNGVTAMKSIAPSAYGAAGAHGTAYGFGAGYGPAASAIAPASLELGCGSQSCGCH